MTASEANKIDINKETNLETLKDLVKYWQDLAFLTQSRISKLQPNFTLEQLKNSDENNDEKGTK